LCRLDQLPSDGCREFLSYDRRHILCTMHGALFEKETGLCVAGPCLGRSLIAVPARIEDGCVIADADAVDHLLRTCNA
jgi:nitrite reductase/ring-hydroxylating ferredoxin subunit